MIEEKIGSRLKAIRKTRNLSLDEMACMTGVSKPMLGQIERGRSIPTITTLWKIATGLKVPLSAFLEEAQGKFEIGRKKEEDAIKEEDGKMRAYPLFPYDPLRNAEVFLIEFDESCKHCSSPHNEGVEEYILVLKGRLLMQVGTEEIELGENEALRFKADIDHAYRNPYDEGCTIYNVIFYPDH
ncbi:helix-turn-helix domain-containing protein [uncultured Dubosiella sp.]|uniref:helix-turn-helix domain-containing protein n=1 Tax=uncultured Dubosiella sp. TaxID=1937011 RepID=UPI0025CEFBDF|nr:XRE family transcriptional regulator [uncultured Dubosiella sp.]